MSGSALQQALASRFSLNTAGVPLRKVLRDVQVRTGVPILLDRRVDPTTVPKVTTSYVTVRDVLTDVVKSTATNSLSITDAAVVVAPADAAQRLRTLLTINQEKVRTLKHALDADVYRKLVETKAISWTDLAEPKRLLLRRAETAGITILNADVVPHDLWGAAELPPMSFTQFATLLLNQFDLTLDFSSSGAVKVTPVPDDITVERRHRVQRTKLSQTIAAWEQQFPGLDITWRGTTALVRTTVEIHEQLDMFVKGSVARTVQSAGLRERSFTMRAPPGTPLGQLVKSFRASGVVIRLEGVDQSRLATLLQVSNEFDLKGVPGREFFPAVFSVWQATVDVRDDEVVVTFAEE